MIERNLSVFLFVLRLHRVGDFVRRSRHATVYFLHRVITPVRQYGELIAEVFIGASRVESLQGLRYEISSNTHRPKF
jgi:hypothetical protein